MAWATVVLGISSPARAVIDRAARGLECGAVEHERGALLLLACIAHDWLGETEATVREVYDPGHPMAGTDGMVRYPAVDMVQEMTTLMTASRGYEANVRSFNFLRNMLLRAIEIGAK